MDQSRRKFLKVLASSPLFLTFGFAGTALMRFAKPSMGPLGIFDPADEAEHVTSLVFEKSYFPEPLSWIPFTSQMKVKVFNASKEEVRSVRGMLFRLNGNHYVAYYRECPKGKGGLNFSRNPREDFGIDLDTPVLYCCCHYDLYDVLDEGVCWNYEFGGACSRAPLDPRPKKFDLKIESDKITIGRLR